MYVGFRRIAQMHYTTAHSAESKASATLLEKQCHSLVARPSFTLAHKALRVPGSHEDLPSTRQTRSSRRELSANKISRMPLPPDPLHPGLLKLPALRQPPTESVLTTRTPTNEPKFEHAEDSRLKRENNVEPRTQLSRVSTATKTTLAQSSVSKLAQATGEAASAAAITALENINKKLAAATETMVAEAKKEKDAAVLAAAALAERDKMSALEEAASAAEKRHVVEVFEVERRHTSALQAACSTSTSAGRQVLRRRKLSGRRRNSRCGGRCMTSGSNVSCRRNNCASSGSSSLTRVMHSGRKGTPRCSSRWQQWR